VKTRDQLTNSYIAKGASIWGAWWATVTGDQQPACHDDEPSALSRACRRPRPRGIKQCAAAHANDPVWSGQSRQVRVISSVLECLRTLSRLPSLAESHRKRVGRSSDFRAGESWPSRRTVAARCRRRRQWLESTSLDSTRLQRRGRPGIAPEFPVCRTFPERNTRPPTHTSRGV
jgi:hypothetical protein